MTDRRRLVLAAAGVMTNHAVYGTAADGGPVGIDDAIAAGRGNNGRWDLRVNREPDHPGDRFDTTEYRGVLLTEAEMAAAEQVAREWFAEV
jgi:hypothetical protein